MSFSRTISKVLPPPSTNGKPKKEAKKEEPAPVKNEPRKPPEDIEAYWEPYRSTFWSKNGRGEWMPFSTDAMTCMLENRGYSAKTFDGFGPSEVKQYLHRIRYHLSIDWAGELGGWPVGLHDVSGLQCLMTRGRRPIIPKRGAWPLMKRFLETLLGKEQLPFFYGWLRGSLQSLQDGFPFRPGQLLALAGDVGCGKSFLQLLITQILGGRQGDPTNYLLGQTTFTAQFFKAEHLLIEDKSLKDFSHAKRRAFAAYLKGLVVNQYQEFHPKGKEAVLLPVGTRISLSCNDAPEALAILPALDSDVADKVLYLLCSQGELPATKIAAMPNELQWRNFLGELPAFVHSLRAWKVPERIRDPRNRYTVRAWHHPEIVERLQQLTPEERLLNLLEVLRLDWPEGGVFVGTAGQVEQWLRSVDLAHQLDRILHYNAQMGTLLSKIAAVEGEERVRILEPDGRKNVYAIDRNEL